MIDETDTGQLAAVNPMSRHAMTCQSCPGLNEPAAPPERKVMPSISQIAGVPPLPTKYGVVLRTIGVAG
jgi:hypothetical protein